MNLVHQHPLLIASSSTSHLSAPAFASCHMNGCRVAWPAKQSCIIQESLCDCVWPHGSVWARLCQWEAGWMHREKKKERKKNHIIHMCAWLYNGLGCMCVTAPHFSVCTRLLGVQQWPNSWGHTGAHCSPPSAMPGFHLTTRVSNILLKALPALPPGCAVSHLIDPRQHLDEAFW